MSVILNKETRLGTFPHEMKDGQLGEIVKTLSGNYLGEVVQRVGDDLITIGKDSDQVWEGHCNSPTTSVQVRILVKGETITVGDN